MHYTAMLNGGLFFQTYYEYFNSNQQPIVVDIGSRDVNGSLRQCVPSNYRYIGVDFEPGQNVDIVLNDPYSYPLEDNSVDIVLSSSCFEHSEMFWLSFLEVMRILKPDGLFYLNAPSNSGYYHRFPVDCWRFFPDSGKALVSWSKRNGINSALLESYVSHQYHDVWSDFVAIFIKEEAFIHKYKNRMLNTITQFNNGHLYGTENIFNQIDLCEDSAKLQKIIDIVSNTTKVV